MKYTVIGFQQKKLLEYKLDVTDALILRTIKDMYSTSKMEFILEEDTKYMWINYSYFLKILPIVGSRSNLMRRIQKYSEELLILRVLKHIKDGKKGSFAYISPTEKLDEMQEFDMPEPKGYVKMTQGVCQNDTGGMSKRHNKDSSNKDSSIKDNKYLEHFETVWELYPNKKGKGKIKNSNTKLKMIYELNDELVRCIDRYVKDVEVRRKDFPELKYQDGSTFFNSGYVDYLDENFEEVEKPKSTVPDHIREKARKMREGLL